MQFTTNLRLTALVRANFFIYFARKTYFLHFTRLLLQNTHINLSILLIYSIKYSFFYIFYYFLPSPLYNPLTNPKSPTPNHHQRSIHTHHHSNRDLRTKQQTHHNLIPKQNPETTCHNHHHREQSPTSTINKCTLNDQRPNRTNPRWKYKEKKTKYNITGLIARAIRNRKLVRTKARAQIADVHYFVGIHRLLRQIKA